jgi:NAD(P)-dependent dehydrogenase (short-subunit alcohol dehydrogenase family)
MDRIVTPFGFASTAAEVAAGIDLGGRRVVVTGAASGIGVETARALAGTCAEVTLAVRDIAAGREVAADISATTGNPAVRVGRLDLGDHASIAAFVDAWDGPLHVLVNNAGIMATPETRTPEGWEIQFATNHLGHFVLTTGLHAALAAAGGARVVNLSSIGHRRSPVMFDDIHFTSRPYDKWSAYGQSKTANVLFGVGITERWAADGITGNAVHPGGIMTNLQRHMDPEEFKIMGWVDADGNVRQGFKTPEQGAATSVTVATSPLLDGIGGRYFEDCNEALPATPDDRRSGVESYALDLGLADRLWEESLRLLDR